MRLNKSDTLTSYIRALEHAACGDGMFASMPRDMACKAVLATFYSIHGVKLSDFASDAWTDQLPDATELLKRLKESDDENKSC